MVLFYQVFFVDKNINKESSINFNSTHVLRITVEDNFINDYKEERCVYQDELKGQLNKFWETESVGLNNYIEDDKLMKLFNDKLNLTGHDIVSNYLLENIMKFYPIIFKTRKNN